MFKIFRRILELLERIAIALETIAKIEPSKPTDLDMKLVEAPDQEQEDEEVLKVRSEAEGLLEENPTNQLWAEDGLGIEHLESME